MKLQLLDVNRNLDDPKRVRAEFELVDGTVQVKIHDQNPESRPALEHALLDGITFPDPDTHVYMPSEGKAYLDAVERRYSRSTYYRTVWVD